MNVYIYVIMIKGIRVGRFIFRGTVAVFWGLMIINSIYIKYKLYRKKMFFKVYI